MQHSSCSRARSSAIGENWLAHEGDKGGKDGLAAPFGSINHTSQGGIGVCAPGGTETTGDLAIAARDGRAQGALGRVVVRGPGRVVDATRDQQMRRPPALSPAGCSRSSPARSAWRLASPGSISRPGDRDLPAAMGGRRAVLRRPRTLHQPHLAGDDRGGGAQRTPDCEELAIG
jgi:hypothetical protein